jgi:hypothetical protein
MPDQEKEHTTNPAIVAFRRHPAVKVLLAVLPAIVASFAGGAVGSGAAEDVKDTARSGYRTTREALLELRQANKDVLERLAHLEAELGAVKRAVRAGRKPPAKVEPPSAQPPTPTPAPLPPTLDQAAQLKAPEPPKP